MLLTERFLKSKNCAPVTLLTNDNNLAVKVQSCGIVALSSMTPSNEPLSSDLLIRQALHGPLPLENTYIRPREGNDIRMFDLSGTMEEHLKFLPGLKESRYAPKAENSGNNCKTKIAIDPDTGAVVLVKNGEKIRTSNTNAYRDLIEKFGDEDLENGVDGAHGNTYADIMAAKEESGLHASEDEMDWE
jgi:hypothetical protein